MIIREFKKTDLECVKSLLQKAFLNHPHGDPKRGVIEHLIVEKLINDNADVLSNVAIEDDCIVGFITFSQVFFDNDAGKWCGLGPVAVLPTIQNKGIGRKLIEYSLEIIKQNYYGCVVLGDPKYYKNFGFENVEGFEFEGIPSEYLLVNTYADNLKPSGKVSYHSAFYI